MNWKILGISSILTLSSHFGLKAQNEPEHDTDSVKTERVINNSPTTTKDTIAVSDSKKDSSYIEILTDYTQLSKPRIQKLFKITPTFAHKLITKLDESAIQLKSTTLALNDYYQRLPEEKRIYIGLALTTLALRNPKPNTDSKIIDDEINTIAELYDSTDKSKFNILIPDNVDSTFNRITFEGLTPLLQKRLDKLRAAEAISFEIIGRHEGIKMIASRNPADGTIDIAFGNHEHPDGHVVKSGEKVKDKDELLAYFKCYMDKNVYEGMINTLAIEKMTVEQIVAIESFMYNAGSGRIFTESTENGKKVFKPTGLTNNLNKFFTDGDQSCLASAETYIRKINTSRKEGYLVGLDNRRDIECRLIKGEISLTNPLLKNYLNPEEIAMGAFHSTEKRKTLSVDNLCDQILCIQGDTLIKTIDKRIAEAQLHQQPIQKPVYKKQARYSRQRSR